MTTPATTTFTIPHDHPCLPGHFPGRPIVPGVVVLDRVLAAIEAAIEAASEAGHGGAPGALRMPQVKFAQPLLPGEEACIALERIEPAPPSDTVPPRWRFRVLRGDALLVSGEIRASGDGGGKTSL